jgi:hypothetical protein
MSLAGRRAPARLVHEKAISCRLGVNSCKGYLWSRILVLFGFGQRFSISDKCHVRTGSLTSVFLCK